MNYEISSMNPADRVIIAARRRAPHDLPRSVLPLPQADLMEVLVALADKTDDAELAIAARQTLDAHDAGEIENIIKSDEAALRVLGFLADAAICRKQSTNQSLQIRKRPTRRL